MAEEGFVLEDKERHAPMAGCALIGLVLRNFSRERVALIANRRLERAGIQSCLGRGVGEMIALVPLIHFAGPNFMRSAPRKLEAAPRMRSG